MHIIPWEELEDILDAVDASEEDAQYWKDEKIDALASIRAIKRNAAIYAAMGARIELALKPHILKVNGCNRKLATAKAAKDLLEEVAVIGKAVAKVEDMRLNIASASLGKKASADMSAEERRAIRVCTLRDCARELRNATKLVWKLRHGLRQFRYRSAIDANRFAAYNILRIGVKGLRKYLAWARMRESANIKDSVKIDNLIRWERQQGGRILAWIKSVSDFDAIAELVAHGRVMHNSIGVVALSSKEKAKNKVYYPAELHPYAEGAEGAEGVKPFTNSPAIVWKKRRGLCVNTPIPKLEGTVRIKRKES